MFSGQPPGYQKRIGHLGGDAYSSRTAQQHRQCSLSGRSFPSQQLLYGIYDRRSRNYPNPDPYRDAHGYSSSSSSPGLEPLDSDASPDWR